MFLLCLKQWNLGRVAYWLTAYARKPKVPCSSPAASYVQRWTLCSNSPANVWVSVKLMEVVVRSYRNALPLPLQSCDSGMFSWKKTQTEKKTKKKNKKRVKYLVVKMQGLSLPQFLSFILSCMKWIKSKSNFDRTNWEKSF